MPPRVAAQSGQSARKLHVYGKPFFDYLAEDPTPAKIFNDVLAAILAATQARSACSSTFPTAGSDATSLDTTMQVFTGSRERTESEYRDLLHRAGLTLVKTTLTASLFSVLESTPAQREQR